MMVVNEKKGPFGLVVTGEARSWQDALERIVGLDRLRTYQVQGGGELLEVVRAGLADAAVLADDAQHGMDAMHMLRLVRRLNVRLPVVIVTARTDRRWLEDALRLTAFSVVSQPLELEELLRQIWRMMARMDAMMRMRPE